MTITTGANRGATVLHRSSTGPTTKHIGGFHRTRFITVETRMFPECAGIAPTPSRLLPVSPGCLNPGCFKQPETRASSTRFTKDFQGCPRCCHDSDTVHPGSSNRDEPAPLTGVLTQVVYESCYLLHL